MEEEIRLEQTLTLFDLCWFRHSVLLPPPPQPTTTPAAAAVLDPEEDARSNASEPPPTSSPRRPIARHRRSLSDERDPFGSDPRLERPRLETILSGKESAAAEISAAAAAAAERGGYRRRRWRRRRRGGSTATTTRSLSDLEFEELKGLMDLGFTFSEAEAAADPRLVEIVPALRRRSSSAAAAEESTSLSTAEGGGDEAAGVARPYLSEAWDAAEEKEEEEEKGYVLRNWRIPVLGDEVDLKENLRLWAHTVASTVR